MYEPTTFCGEDLVNIMDIDLEGNVLLPKLSIDVACDVQNPLIGPLGAVNVLIVNTRYTNSKTGVWKTKGCK